MNIAERLKEAAKHPLARSSYLTAQEMIDPVIGPALEKTYGIIRDRRGKLREVLRHRLDEQLRDLPADKQKQRLREEEKNVRLLSDAEVFDGFFVETETIENTVKFWLLDEAGVRVLELTGHRYLR